MLGRVDLCCTSFGLNAFLLSSLLAQLISEQWRDRSILDTVSAETVKTRC